MGHHNIYIMKKVDENEIMELYDNKHTIRHIAEIIGIDHHRVKRILLKNNIILTKRKTIKQKKECSDYTRNLISLKNKGKKKTQLSEDTKKKITMSKKSLVLSDISEFENFSKFMYLARVTKKYKEINKDKFIYLSFIKFFYYDTNFNNIYDRWLENNKNKWYAPSLDHIIPISKGGLTNMDNLRFITWFENKAKSDMHLMEWEKFKIKFNIKSNLFI